MLQSIAESGASNHLSLTEQRTHPEDQCRDSFQRSDQKDQHHRHEGGRANTTPRITDMSFDNDVRVVRAQQETIMRLLAQTITQMMALHGVSKEPGCASSVELIVSRWHNR